MRIFARVAAVAIVVLVGHACFGEGPTISKVDAQEDANRVTAHTISYPAPGTDAFTVWRRSIEVTIGVDLSVDYDPAKHEVGIEVSHSFKPTPMSLTLFPGVAAVAGDWALRDTGVTTKVGKKTVQLSIRIADGIPIGQYAFSAIVREKGKVPVLNRMAFPRGVVILFNPWSDKDPVYMPNKEDRHEYLIVEESPWETQLNDKPKSWMLDQFDMKTLKALLRMLKTPDPTAAADEMTIETRSSPILFSRAMSASIRKYAQGDWVTTNFETGEIDPSTWKRSSSLFAKFDAPPVKYVRCWGYAQLLNSLFRCAGMPARTISCKAAAHEKAPFDGKMIVNEVLENGMWVLKPGPKGDDYWGLHAWTEAWMKRPDRADSDGWQVVDGTYSIGPAPVSAVKAKSGGNYEVDFVASEVTSAVTFMRGAKIDRIDTKKVGERIITKKRGTAAVDNIRLTYRAAALREQQLDDGAVTWEIPEISSPGSDVLVVAHMSNSGAAPMEIELTVAAYAECYEGSPRGEVHPPEYRLIALDPGTIDHTEEFLIPWQAYASFALVSDHLRVDAVAVCDAVDMGWPAQERVLFDLPGLLVARTSLSVVAPGESVECAVELLNPFETALTGCVLELETSDGLEFAGLPGSTTESVDVGDIAPGATVTITRSFLAKSEGTESVLATIRSDLTPQFTQHALVKVTSCIADLVDDGMVDDVDFVQFAEAYVLLVAPPADPLCDFNRDGIVDDTDFTFFAASYERFYCESNPD